MKWLPIFLLTLVISSCDFLNEEPQLISAAELQQYQEEILLLASSVPCTNAAEWRIIPLGSKACGGPDRYIAYHQSVEKEFLEKATRFTALQKEYNEKNNDISNCRLVEVPLAVSCVGNAPVLTY